MKQLNKVSVILLGVAVLFIVYLLECKRNDCLELKDGEMVIATSLWEEVMALADKPADTTYIHDTIIIKKPVYIRIEIPVPVETKDSITHYQDSIVNDEIRFWEDIWVKGVISAWEKKYEPVIQIREITTERIVPQIVEMEVPIYKRELYLSGALGGNAEMFSYGVDLDFINKKRNVYGLQYRRVHNEGFYYFKIGTKLLPR